MLDEHSTIAGGVKRLLILSEHEIAAGLVQLQIMLRAFIRQLLVHLRITAMRSH